MKEEFAEVLKKLQTSVGRVGDVIGRLGSFARFEDIIDTSSIVGNSMKPIVDMINQDISKIGAINLSNYIQESGTYDVLTSTLRNLNTGIFSSNALTSTKMAELMSDITSSQFDFGQVIQPLLDIQEHNAIIMRQLIQDLSPAEGLFSRNNRLIAGILEDALAIRQFGALPENYTAFHDTLLNFSDVNQSFRRLFDTVATPIILADPNLDLSKLSNSMIVPTMTMGYYTRSVRELVNTETETETNESPNQERTSEEFHELGDESLDEILARLNPEFVEMRKGAWWALRIPGPDYLRHAGASQRELLRQLFELLVPQSDLPEDNRKGPQLKARLRIILNMSDTDAEYVESMSKAVASQYDQLNKYTHHNKKYESLCRAILHTGEGVIRFVLAYLDLSKK